MVTEMKLYLKIDDTKNWQKRGDVSTVWYFNKKLIQVHTMSLVDLNCILLFQILCSTQMRPK